jgi:hypothetical protein
MAPADCWNWGEWGTQRVQMKGVLGWFIRLVMPVQEIFALSWRLYSQPSTKYVLPHYTISIPVYPSPRKLGRQPCWVACLLVCVSGVISAHVAFFRHNFVACIITYTYKILSIVGEAEWMEGLKVGERNVTQHQDRAMQIYKTLNIKD